MSDPESPPPLPKGSYTINWDEIDEFADPMNMKPPTSKSLAHFHYHPNSLSLCYGKQPNMPFELGGFPLLVYITHLRANV